MEEGGKWEVEEEAGKREVEEEGGKGKVEEKGGKGEVEEEGDKGGGGGRGCTKDAIISDMSRSSGALFFALLFSGWLSCAFFAPSLLLRWMGVRLQVHDSGLP